MTGEQDHTNTDHSQVNAEHDHFVDTANNLAKKIAIPSPGDCPYTLLLGAGASVSSGIRHAGALLEEWRHDLYRAQKGIPTRSPIDAAAYSIWYETEHKRWLNAKLQGKTRESEYSVLFSRFHKSRRQRQIFIEREIEGKTPSFGYLYLAGLIGARRINRVLTTNFDDLINDALVRFYDIKPIVCAFDSAIRSIRFDSLRPKILKLHGDFLYDNIKNVSDEVVHLEANMEEKFLQTCKEGGLVVVGYDGADESIMGPLQFMVRNHDYLKMGLHWCLYHPDLKQPLTIPAKLRPLLDNYPDKITIYPIQGFDELMYEVFTQCECSHPDIFMDPGKKNVLKELQTAIGKRWQSFDIPPGMNDHLELYIERSENKGSDPQLELDRANIKHRRANHMMRDVKDLVSARALFEESRAKATGVLAAGDGVGEGFRHWAWRRLAGNFVGLMECDQGESKDWSAHFEAAIRAVVEADAIAESTAIVSKLTLEDRRLPAYNAVCAYALIARTRSLQPDEISAARTYLVKLEEVRPGGEG